MKIFKLRLISKPALVCAVALMTSSCSLNTCEKQFFNNLGYGQIFSDVPPSNPQAYIDAGGKIVSFNGPDSPGGIAATKFQVNTSSMVFWEQSANPQVAAENITGAFSRLYFVAGGKLDFSDTAGTQVFAASFDPKISAALTVDSVATSASDGGWIYASHPNDAAVSLFGGASFTQKKLIRLPSRTPTKLAVSPSGAAYALSGTSLISFDLTGETGNVGIPAGAAGLDASDKYVVVTNQAQGTVLVFNPKLHQIGQPVKVSGANRVAIVGDSAFVTGASTSTTTPPIPNTGQGLYTIVSDSTGEIYDGDAAVPVTGTLPDGWMGSAGAAPLPANSSAKWIGPDANQSNAKRNGCCFETIDFYQTKFTVADPANASFVIDFAADEYVDVLLNGNPVFTHTADQMYASTTRLTLTSGFKPGLNANTLEFDVFNSGGGPTGLYVSVSQVLPGNVTQIDLTDETITGTVAVGPNPGDIRASSTGAILVANTGADTISILNGLSVTSTVTVGSGPTVIAVKPGDGN